MINKKELSVVVQGPILIVGNINITALVLKSVRKFLPGSEIILSTWENSNVNNLEFDKLVLNKDPGSIEFKLNKIKFNYNVNRQIITTLSGIKASSRQFTLKIRSDIILKGNYFLKLFDQHKFYNTEYKFFKKRILTSNASSFNPRKKERRLFNPSDWFFLGFTSDLLLLWDIDLFDTKFYSNQEVQLPFNQEEYPSPEQYVWTSFLSKFITIPKIKLFTFNKSLLLLSEKVLVNNLQILLPSQLGFESYKYRNSSKISTLNNYLRYYSRRDWEILYKRHCYNKFKLSRLDSNEKFLFLKLIFSYISSIKEKIFSNHNIVI
jgi:hypothetical protein